MGYGKGQQFKSDNFYYLVYKLHNLFEKDPIGVLVKKSKIPSLVLSLSLVLGHFPLSGGEKGLSFRQHKLFVDFNEACEIADFNKDGVLDISAGRNWYPGPDYVPHALRTIEEFGKDYQENNAEHAMDVDGDGWLDLVSTPFKGSEMSWYKNPGQPNLSYGKLWEKKSFGAIQKSNEIVFFEDLDGDGQKDMISNS